MRLYLCSAELPALQTNDFWNHWTSELMHELRGSRYVQMRHIDAPGIVTAKHSACLLTKADIVVMNLSVPCSPESANLGVIAAIAHAHSIPVYTFHSDYDGMQSVSSPWVEQFVTARFQNTAELVDFLTFDETL